MWKHHQIWFPLLPLKLHHFIWLILRLLVSDVLYKQKIATSVAHKIKKQTGKYSRKVAVLKKKGHVSWK